MYCGVPTSIGLSLVWGDIWCRLQTLVNPRLLAEIRGVGAYGLILVGGRHRHGHHVAADYARVAGRVVVGWLVQSDGAAVLVDVGSSHVKAPCVVVHHNRLVYAAVRAVVLDSRACIVRHDCYTVPAPLAQGNISASRLTTSIFALESQPA